VTKSPSTDLKWAIVLTALEIETRAVLRHLVRRSEEIVDGTSIAVHSKGGMSSWARSVLATLQRQRWLRDFKIEGNIVDVWNI
jgi:hypothetical protein